MIFQISYTILSLYNSILLKFKYFIFFTLSIFSISIFANDYHNIQNFFGERATGMGGAFTALSDDASGSYYNPAGTAFTQSNHYSVNASSYKTGKQEFKDLFGPGQNYTRESRNYLPNFIGFTRRINDKWNFGMSLINPINESFDQSNRITLPIYRSNLSQIDINYNRENFQLLAGPTIGYLIKNNLSIGLTGYYLYDTYKLTQNSNENQFNDSVTVVQQQDRRRTSGVIPILGIQYVPFTKFSLGLSIKRIFVTGGNVSLTRNITTASSLSRAPTSILAQGSENLSAITSSDFAIISGGLSSKIPETTEIRAGWAFFPTSRFTITMDGIYTSGYKLFLNQSKFNLNSQTFTYIDPFANEYNRNQTFNYAMGIEYYITENIVVRLGHFTNYSNNRKVSWLEAALLAESRNGIGSIVRIDSRTQIELPTYREILVNLNGYSIGLGYETSSTSVSIAVTHQSGKGLGIADPFQLPSRAIINDTTLYLTGGSKY
ncbi:MAG: hypothetical protein SFU98_02705 [Leptospiraceae bacterium]|nr:hypothetical protein [Leptospiraceae bacterium]